MSDLIERRCQACNRNTPRLPAEAQLALLRQVPEWELAGERLRRRFRFAGFRQAIAFVDRMADIAESEGHHPIFSVDYDQVDVSVWTHAIDALSENDFILAAKLDQAAHAS
jgi:4a-hydroxytetrahydrobiopterin dehydratase